MFYALGSIVALLPLVFFFLNQAYKVGTKNGYKSGWIAGIDYERQRTIREEKDGIR